MKFRKILLILSYTIFTTPVNCIAGASLEYIEDQKLFDDQLGLILQALEKKELALCPSPKIKRWIEQVCWERIFFLLKDPQKCSSYKAKYPNQYLPCIGITANSLSDRKLCKVFLKKKEPSNLNWNIQNGWTTFSSIQILI